MFFCCFYFDKHSLFGKKKVFVSGVRRCCSLVRKKSDLLVMPPGDRGSQPHHMWNSAQHSTIFINSRHKYISERRTGFIIRRYWRHTLFYLRNLIICVSNFGFIHNWLEQVSFFIVTRVLLFRHILKIKLNLR